MLFRVSDSNNSSSSNLSVTALYATITYNMHPFLTHLRCCLLLLLCLFVAVADRRQRGDHVGFGCSHGHKSGADGESNDRQRSVHGGHGENGGNVIQQQQQHRQQQQTHTRTTFTTIARIHNHARNCDTLHGSTLQANQRNHSCSIIIIR